MKILTKISIYLMIGSAPCNIAHAIFGEQTALLMELVSTSVSELNELERLVSSAEKYTKTMVEYNELFQDGYFKAERVLYIAENFATRKKITNLSELNGVIRELKYSMSELRFLMVEYAEIQELENKTEQIVILKKKLIKRKKARASIQLEQSLQAKTQSRSNQLTAENTALIHETQLEMQETQLEMLKRLSTTNRLLSEELEDSRLQQIEKTKSYRFNSTYRGNRK
jgi:hypothetical protein